MIAKIIIASTLKPVWDPRAYEKIGKSLAATGDYAVEIIGSGTIIPDDSTVKFHNHQISRSVFSRVFLQFKIFRKLLKSRPDLLIIGTHELILPAVIFKLLTGKKLIYDIRENYNYNLRYQKIYPFGIRQFLAWYIRGKEVVFQKSFDFFFCAEQCYLTEIKYLNRNRSIVLVLENKATKKIKLIEGQKDSPIQLLLSGTISESYGVFDAIKYFKSLPPDLYLLKVIGHCPEHRTKAQIIEQTSGLLNIELELSDQPIPRSRIVGSYTSRTIGLLPYQANKSTKNKVPTKLFEYAANGIPVLISQNPNWCKFVAEHKCGMCIDFLSPSNRDELRLCFKLKESILSIDSQVFMWNYYEPDLFKTIETVLKN